MKDLKYISIGSIVLIKDKKHYGKLGIIAGFKDFKRYHIITSNNKNIILKNDRIKITGYLIDLPIGFPNRSAVMILMRKILLDKIITNPAIYSKYFLNKRCI
uniref:Ribosomal protein L14a n=1 Tax=Amorphochlora amoebiformis TaxID=1561963 RepID=A0A0H5BKG3_9EUKA|nr:ribosomal protein L14a [Amorphochlora amoebiformis]